MSIEQLIYDCDLLLNAGQVESAHKKLISLNAAAVPRHLRLPAANQCRRAGLHNAGLKLLAPLVHPNKTEWGQDASSQEIAEFALLLHGAGIPREALDTLDRVNPSQLPEAFWYRAMCHVDLNDHAEACIHLNLFLGRSDITALNRIEGRLTLADCLITMEKWDEAVALLNDILLSEEIAAFTNLRARANVLRAQIFIHAAKFTEARADLTAAANAGGDPSQIHKWTRIADALETNNKTILQTFRAEAESRKDWDSVRDADHFILKIEFHEDTFNWMMFGTSSPALRRLLEHEHGRGPTKTNLIVGDEKAPALDLITGEITGDRIGQSPPRLVHRLVNALMRDFYRPVSTGALFADLFPGENFDVFSSIHRVHQAIHRTRRWFESQQIPVVISEHKGHYSLSVNGYFAVRVPFERLTMETEVRRFQALAGHFAESGGFTARQAREALGMSPAVFKALMSWAEETGHISRLGAGPSTRYRIIAA